MNTAALPRDFAERERNAMWARKRADAAPPLFTRRTAPGLLFDSMSADAEPGSVHMRVFVSHDLRLALSTGPHHTSVTLSTSEARALAAELVAASAAFDTGSAR